MFKPVACFFITLMLSGCSFFSIHQSDVEQGNVISMDKVKRLEQGMTEAQVEAVLGRPILTNIFSPNRLDYVYTLQHGKNPRVEQHIICLFENGRLKSIQRD